MLQPPAAGSGSGVRILLAPVSPSRRFRSSPEPFRPDWLAMVLILLALALLHRTNVGTAWVAGLLLDVLPGSTLWVRPWPWLSPPIWGLPVPEDPQLLPLAAGADHRPALLVGKITVFWAEHLFSRASLTSPILVDGDDDVNMALDFLWSCAKVASLQYQVNVSKTTGL